ncbi:MAG: rRNA (cytidine1920-2-O)/16S rRNA (cytidine1409-2-O)-methyltransferase [Chloroflexota bacterium]|nr:rRNA (cytidine1920-2-O)/16S rRNA (cytidine1409-2-O)-methyltransferase [Chloroflexota bacterium]
MKKQRLDVLMVERGLVESRSLAQKLTMAGEVLVDGQLASKPGQTFPESVTISLKAKPPFVSRGGEKLLGALEAFALTDLDGWTCVDVGASTGGFTDCMLQHGAVKVYAVDVGYGQLHDKLRRDERVVEMERTNARNIDKFPDEPDLVTIDASFISLKILLPVIRNWNSTRDQRVVALIKPQFEVGRDQAAKGKGVVRDQRLHQQVVADIQAFSKELGYQVRGVTESPLTGPKGNKEFLIYLYLPANN